MPDNDDIQDNIEYLRELILELDETIWLRINHKDPAALAGYMEKKQVINERIAAFQKSGLELLDALAMTEPANEPQVGHEAEEPTDDETITPITRHFVSVKPKAMIFGDERIGPLKSWRAVWNRFLDEFHQRYPDKFQEILVETSCIAGNADTPDSLITHYECGGRFFECTLSANDIAKRMTKILRHAGLDTSTVKIVLRGNPDLEGTMFG
ncbi:MAG: hypothetical protein ACPGR4_04890 [Paracoccaceae bacterium]